MPPVRLIIQAGKSDAMTETTSTFIHFVLIRGLIREAAHWGELPARLRQTFPGARVSCLDIPGAGVLHRERTPLSVTDMVTAMRETFLAQQQRQEITCLLAISLGGMIAANWLQRFPGDFRCAVLINTSFGDLSPLHHRLRPGALGWMTLAALAPARHKEALILRMVSNDAEAARTALPQWQQIRTERPVALGNAVRQLWAASRFRLGNDRPAVPVLLLAGTRDRMVHVDCSRVIARTWQVSLQEHSQAGHDLALDDPDWIVNKTHQFIHDSAGKTGVR